MNGILCHLCAHMGQSGPGEPPEDGEMNEVNKKIIAHVFNEKYIGIR